VLAYHTRTGFLLNCGAASTCDGRPFDPWLLPSKLHPQGVLAYDGAATFYGLATLEHTCAFSRPPDAPLLHR